MEVLCHDLMARVRADFGAFALETDSFTALLGAHRGAPGGMVIAGTGSVAEVVYANGQRKVVGGWGFPLDDGGSGSWMGYEAVRHTLRVIDGRDQGGALAQSIGDVVGFDRNRLSAWCKKSGQHEFAQLAPLVFKYGAVDASAAHIVNTGRQCIEELIETLRQVEDVPIAILGSIGKLYFHAFLKRCAKHVLKLKVMP